MNLTVRLLGTEVFAISTEVEQETEHGDATSVALGFSARMDVPEMVD